MKPLDWHEARRKVLGTRHTRECAQCGRQFDRHNLFRVYCSDSCRRRAYYQRHGK
jgi:hypothetical protein